MLLYCVEINKGASAAPVVRGQPLFTGTRCELYTNIRYEQRLCHEYRAGLEAGCLIMGESRYEGPWKSSLVFANPQKHHFASRHLLGEGDPPTQRGHYRDADYHLHMLAVCPIMIRENKPPRVEGVVLWTISRTSFL